MARRRSLVAHLRRWTVRGRGLFAAVVVGAVAVVGCTGEGAKEEVPDDRSARTPSTATGAASAEECHPEMRSGKLPEWARAGFTDGTAGHFVLGERGRLVGVVFGYPLSERSTFEPGRQNKIRWIPRDVEAAEAAGRLRITAVRAGDGHTVRREVSPWPGSSVIDMPAAGCWSLTLHWGAHTDTVDLHYGAQ